MAGKWVTKPDLDPKEVLRYIREVKAPTTSEIKLRFQTDSKSIRRACGVLMAHNLVLPMPFGIAVVWLETTGKKGMPPVKRLRRAGGLTLERQTSHRQSDDRKPRAVGQKTRDEVFVQQSFEKYKKSRDPDRPFEV